MESIAKDAGAPGESPAAGRHCLRPCPLRKATGSVGDLRPVQRLLQLRKVGLDQGAELRQRLAELRCRDGVGILSGPGGRQRRSELAEGEVRDPARDGGRGRLDALGGGVVAAQGKIYLL